MSKPGPPPKPTALRVVQGNPSNRPLPKNEPKPKTAVPACPSHLKESAKKEWRRITKELKVLGLISHIDRAALAAYCQAWGRWVEAEEKVAETNDIIKTKGGNIIQNPYLSVANRALDQLTKIAAEFGMTPASRTRVSADTSNKNGNAFARNGKKSDGS